MKRRILPEGIGAALAAALLFGASPALAKLLLARVDPWLLAALLYLGCGLGLWLYRRLRRSAKVRLETRERGWLAGAVLSGGVVGPVLLLFGLSRMAASNAALLLNAESVFTALLAWGIFRENLDRRIALGMALIVSGGVLLAWPGGVSPTLANLWPALAILGACAAWAIDNNLMRKVSLADATYLAMVKGLVAGSANLLLAWATGAHWPASAGVTVPAALLLGFASYGTSLVLFVVALRHLGTARCGAYFSVAPFFGAALAVALLSEPLTWRLLAAGGSMAVGVALHLAERHEHRHAHEAIEHSHAHTHGAGDAHHDHRHEDAEEAPPGTRHAHAHRHEPLVHSHPHYPDAHHRHRH